jgi:hypothetical protein
MSGLQISYEKVIPAKPKSMTIEISYRVVNYDKKISYFPIPHNKHPKRYLDEVLNNPIDFLARYEKRQVYKVRSVGLLGIIDDGKLTGEVDLDNEKNTKTSTHSLFLPSADPLKLADSLYEDPSLIEKFLGCRFITAKNDGLYPYDDIPQCRLISIKVEK